MKCRTVLLSQDTAMENIVYPCLTWPDYLAYKPSLVFMIFAVVGT